jgi:hypothetical protein
MKTYRLIDGKWGNWRAAQYASECFIVRRDVPDRKDVILVDASGEIDTVKPDGDTFCYSEEISGAYCPALLRHTVHLTLDPDEFNALANLKFTIPETNVQDDIFGALAKLKAALERAESEGAPRHAYLIRRDFCGRRRAVLEISNERITENEKGYSADLSDVSFGGDNEPEVTS